MNDLWLWGAIGTLVSGGAGFAFMRWRTALQIAGVRCKGETRSSSAPQKEVVAHAESTVVGSETKCTLGHDSFPKDSEPVQSGSTVSVDGNGKERKAILGTHGQGIASDNVAPSIALHRVWENPSLKDLVKAMKYIPTMPTIYAEMMQELKKIEPSITTIGEIIERDLGMTSKFLQVVNSPYYGVPAIITNPAHAATLLGFDATKALVLSIGVFARVERLRVKGFSVQRLWKHSVNVGLWARAIAQQERMDASTTEDAFTAGLLHDVGTLAYVMNRPDDYRVVLGDVDKNKGLTHHAEARVFGATHAEMGAVLVNNWGLKESVAEAIAFHHNPLEAGTSHLSLLTTVHAADILDYESQAANGEVSMYELDPRYLELIGASDRLPAWREVCYAP